MRSRVTPRNPKRSMRKMVRELEIYRKSLRKLVPQDLGLKDLKRKAVHHLIPSILHKIFKDARDSSGDSHQGILKSSNVTELHYLCYSVVFYTATHISQNAIC